MHEDGKYRFGHRSGRSTPLFLPNPGSIPKVSVCFSLLLTTFKGRSHECGAERCEHARICAQYQGRNHVFKVGGSNSSVYVIIQTDGIPSFVHCSVLRNGNHTLHQKVGVVRPNFGGPDPHSASPSGCAVAQYERPLTRHAHAGLRPGLRPG